MNWKKHEILKDKFKYLCIILISRHWYWLVQKEHFLGWCPWVHTHINTEEGHTHVSRQQASVTNQHNFNTFMSTLAYPYLTRRSDSIDLQMHHVNCCSQTYLKNPELNRGWTLGCLPQTLWSKSQELVGLSSPLMMGTDFTSLLVLLFVAKDEELGSDWGPKSHMYFQTLRRNRFIFWF